MKERIYDFKAKEHDRYWDELKEYYLEYQVPYKKGIKRSLLVYNLTINPYLSNQQAKHDKRKLWDFLTTMENIAGLHMNERKRREGIVDY